MTKFTIAKSFGEFSSTSRTFWVIGIKLTVSRRCDERLESKWISASGDEISESALAADRTVVGIDPETGGIVYNDGTSDIGQSVLERVPSTVIDGSANSEDSVCVIGHEQHTQSAFPLKIKSDEHVKQDWKELRPLKGDIFEGSDGAERAPEQRFWKTVLTRLDENPPTASLGVDNTDQMISEKSWWLECAIPPSVLKQLEIDLLEGRVEDIRIGIKWEGGLVHGGVYALAHHAATWGLFSLPGGHGSEPLLGHVTSVFWNLHAIQHHDAEQYKKGARG